MRCAALVGLALLGLGSCSQGLGERCSSDSDCTSPLRCELRGRSRGVCTYSLTDAARARDVSVEQRSRDQRGSQRDAGLEARVLEARSESRPPAPDRSVPALDLAPPDLARDQPAAQ